MSYHREHRDGANRSMQITGENRRKCLSSPKEFRPRTKPDHAGQTALAGRGFGTDFWHAVEFSRNGRTPVRAFRPFLGQPTYFTDRDGEVNSLAPSALPSYTDRGCGWNSGRPPWAGRFTSGFPWGVKNYREPRGRRQSRGGSCRCPFRPPTLLPPTRAKRAGRTGAARLGPATGRLRADGNTGRGPRRARCPPCGVVVGRRAPRRRRRRPRPGRGRGPRGVVRLGASAATHHVHAP